MKIEFQDSASNVIALDTLKDRTTEISLSNVTFRTNTIQRYGRDGAQATGDKSANPRTITMKFVQTSKAGDIATADAAYFELLNQILGLFSIPENGPFFLVDTDNNRRAEVEMKSYGDSALVGNQFRTGKNVLAFNWLSSRWEDTVQEITSTPTGGIGNGETLVVNNPGHIRAFAIITLTPVASTLGQFTIRNQTNGSATRIGASNFAVGTTMTIDAVDGLITLDTGTSVIDSSAALASRFGFIVLEPGNNTILYESAFGDADMTVKIREQYYF